MKKIMGVLMLSFALCATKSIFVYASESTYEVHEDETYIYYETGVYDKLTGEYYLYEDGSLDADGRFILCDDNNVSGGDGSETDSSLSDEHLKILDVLGDLLEYAPSGDEENIDIDSVERDVLSDVPDDSDYIESIAADVSAMSDIMLLSNYDTYYGSISSTYLEYMRGFLGKFPYNYHYVAFRSSQYDYMFVFGKDIFYNGSGNFSGSDVTVIDWNTRNNGSYTVSQQGSFGLNAGSNMVYTDLGTDYPSLMDYSAYQLIQLKWLALITVFSVWMTTLYKGIHKASDKDKKAAHINAD